MGSERPLHPSLEVPARRLPPAPGRRLGFGLGVAGIGVFWVTYWAILDRAGSELTRDLGLLAAVALGLLGWVRVAQAQGIARELPQRYRPASGWGLGCLGAAGLGSVVLAGGFYLLATAGSRTRAVEKYLQNNVAMVAGELATTLEELHLAPSARKAGLPGTAYPPTAAGTRQLAQDAIRHVMGLPEVQGMRHPYRAGEAFQVGPAGHQVGTVYLDFRETGLSPAEGPAVEVTGVFKGAAGRETWAVKRVPVQPLGAERPR